MNVVLVVCATAMLRMLGHGRAARLGRAYAVLGRWGAGALERDARALAQLTATNRSMAAATVAAS